MIFSFADSSKAMTAYIYAEDLLFPPSLRNIAYQVARLVQGHRIVSMNIIFLAVARLPFWSHAAPEAVAEPLVALLGFDC